MPDALAIPGWAQSLGAATLFVLVGWLIYRDWRKPQSGVEAQTDAAAIALLKEMREERRETREELSQVRERVAVLEEDKRRHADVLSRHASWDARAVAVVQQLDSTHASALGDPPPLYPPGV